MRDLRLRRLLAALSADASGRGEAVWELGFRLSGRRLSRRRRDRVLGRLAHVARSDVDPDVRRAAIHAFLWHHGSQDATPWLVASARSDPEVSVRGQALEALGVRWAQARPDAARHAAVVDVVREGLGSPAGEVRFWALYAVAVMGLHGLRPAVEALVGDPERAALPWTVGEEASDVLAVLDGHGWPERG
ncbi:MAG: HEAT repeat domain-containing protein [Alphaproteobacteria bacterium]|nr:HEAT repeat domain-containing protein [Alphaproteobacteria bacterium]